MFWFEVFASEWLQERVLFLLLSAHENSTCIVAAFEMHVDCEKKQKENLN